MGEQAKEIAALVNACSVETRGNLFLKIAAELRVKGQNYTASLFESIAHVYGIDEKAA